MKTKSRQIVGFAYNGLRPKDWQAGFSIYAETDSEVPAAFYEDIFIKTNGKLALNQYTNREELKQILNLMIDEAEVIL